MADTIPDLWGEGIDIDELSPAIILDTQAAKLQQRTGGVITAQILKRNSPTNHELLFDLDNINTDQRSRLLVCRYAKDDVYPAWISSLALKKETATALGMGMGGLVRQTRKLPDWLQLNADESECTEVASNQNSFVEILRRILSSAYVKSKIASVVARLNEEGHTLTHLKEDPYYQSAGS